MRRNIQLLFVVVGVLVGSYTLAVWRWSPDDLLGWFSTLISTVLSVLAALVIGLVLFQHQTQETDRKKKAELSELLKTELGEIRRVMEKYRTAHGMQYVLHYPHPLIVEEAARSGLFDTEQASEMLVLARIMRQHILLRQEAMTLRVEKVRVQGASGDQYSEATEYFTWALRTLQESEGDIINGCTKLLESLP